MEQIFNNFVNGFGLSSAHVLVLLVVLSLVCNVLGRLIPDDATGFLGVLRRIAKVLGLYVSNRIGADGVSVNSVTKAVVESALPDRVAEIESRAILKPFPDANVVLTGRDSKGQFAKLESPWFVTAFVILLMLPLLGGCATASLTQVRPALQALCSTTDTLAIAINLIRDDTNRNRALIGLHALEAGCPLLFPTALREANRLRANA